MSAAPSPQPGDAQPQPEPPIMPVKVDYQITAMTSTPSPSPGSDPIQTATLALARKIEAMDSQDRQKLEELFAHLENNPGSFIGAWMLKRIE
jgi:hypothetical protein